MTEIKRVKKPEWKPDDEQKMNVLWVDNTRIMACYWQSEGKDSFEGKVCIGGLRYSQRASNMEHEIRRMLEDDLLYLADEIRIAAGRFILIYREVEDDSGCV